MLVRQSAVDSDFAVDIPLSLLKNIAALTSLARSGLLLKALRFSSIGIAFPSETVAATLIKMDGLVQRRTPN